MVIKQVDVLMILVMFRELDPETDVENMKMKEERRNMLSDDDCFGFHFFIFCNICVLKEFGCSEETAETSTT